MGEKRLHQRYNSQNQRCDSQKIVGGKGMKRKLVHNKLLNFKVPESLNKQHKKAWKILLFKSQAHALRDAMERQVEEASQKNKDWMNDEEGA